MHNPLHGVRRSGRRLSTGAVLAATAALLVAPMPASAAGITYVSGSDIANADGWISRSSTRFDVNVDVDASPPPTDGAVQDRFMDFQCHGSSGDDAFASWVHGGITPTDKTGIVQVLGEGIHEVECTASYLQATWSCSLASGCTLPDYSPVTRTYSRTVRIDSQPPVFLLAQPDVLPNAAGWYRTPGTVHFSGTDVTSGIRSCSQLALSGFSAAFQQQVVGSCTDHADNTESRTFVYRYDDRAPTLAPTVSPSVVPLGATVTALANAIDAQSGVKSQGCDPVDTSTPGVHTVRCTATDVADNTASATATYTVAYGFSGYAQPVDANARNVAKAGRTIPLKWRVTDAAGAPVTDVASVTVTASSLSCAAGTTVDDIEEYASGSSGLQNLGNGYYQFNWSTPKSYASSCKTLRLDLGDGIARTATFEFTK
jgi:hypothetical protein